MAKLINKRCAMCSGRIESGKIVIDGEHNFCDEYCKNWFHSTYDQKEVKPID